MNILFFNLTSLRSGGGFERWLFDIVPQLKKIGHDITIATCDLAVYNRYRLSLNEVNKILGKKCKIYEFKSWKIPIGSSLLPTIPSYLWFKKKIQTFDIVYFPATGLYFQDLLIFLEKIKKNIPVIAGIHTSPLRENSLNLYTNIVTRHTLKIFDVCHVLNPYVKNLLKSWGIINIFLLPHAIDLEKYKPKSHKNNSFCILFAGRLVLEKGIDIFYKVLKILNNSPYHTNLKFLIAGSGDLKIQNYIKDLSNKFSNVTYLGYVSQEKMPELYQKCDLFVSPSRTETFGWTILEAQACGVPVIASDIPGPNNVIINNETGILIPVSNVKSLEKAIKHFYNLWKDEPHKFKEFRRRSRQNIEKKYSLTKYIKKLNEFFANVLSLVS
ncbi:MAG: glycosyltransferase family 4 protein [Candidatus Hodarchaeota archaeon]